MKNDKQLGMNSQISRRDFCQGSLLTLGALTSSWSLNAFAETPVRYYPPTLTGMRGSHVGAFETAHALAREGKTWPRPSEQTDSDYDVVIVGAGLSGLSAAHFLQQRWGKSVRILLLDNHDDFGGHAKRNEFTVNGKTLLGYGGSESLESPAHYSKVAKQLLQDMGVDTQAFYKAYDQGFYQRHHLHSQIFFAGNNTAKARLMIDQGLIRAGDNQEQLPDDAWYQQLPLSETGREQLKKLLESKADYLSGRTSSQKKVILSKISYRDYLLTHVGVSDEVAELFQASFSEIWGVHADSTSALEHWRNGYPGFVGVALDDDEGGDEHDEEPYIFHFPDGNASLARLLVRHLIPSAAPGSTMFDIVNSPFDYAQLDRTDNPVRLRLNSTVVNVTQDGKGVDVVYVSADQASRVRANHVVLACYHVLIPHLCPQLPEAQQQALKQQVKVPLVYINVALRDGKALHKAQFADAYCPHSYFPFVRMDYPVSMGGYHFAQSPNDPHLIRLIRVPCLPKQGLPAREQHRVGRHELLATSFEQFEREIRAQLQAMFAPYGFEAARDIVAITVNRWPHGYAYEYNELFDPEWPPGKAPHQIAAQSVGRIHIANSDAQARAYVDAAIDAAWKAVQAIPTP